MKFYYLRNGVAQGPVDREEIDRLRAMRRLQKDMVCADGSEEWLEYKKAFPAGPGDLTAPSR